MDVDQPEGLEITWDDAHLTVEGYEAFLGLIDARNIKYEASVHSTRKEKQWTGFEFLMRTTKSIAYALGAGYSYEGSEDVADAVYNVAAGSTFVNGSLLYKAPPIRGAEAQGDVAGAVKEKPKAVGIPYANPVFTNALNRNVTIRILVSSAEVKTKEKYMENYETTWKEGNGLSQIAKKTPCKLIVKTSLLVQMFGICLDRDKKVRTADLIKKKEAITVGEKWQAVVQGLGRFSDLANRLDGLLYQKNVSIWGQMQSEPAFGWLVWRGSKLSKNQLVKYANSLDAGNQLKAIGVQRGQLAKKKMTNATRVIATNKLRKLSKKLAERCIHGAQKYIVRKLGDANHEVSHTAIKQLIASFAFDKPKMETRFQCPVAYWDNSGQQGWKGQIEMMVKNYKQVLCAYPQLPWISCMSLPYEDLGIVQEILGERPFTRAEYAETTAKHFSSKTLSCAKMIKVVFPPMKGSPSGATEDAQTIVGGVACRIERQNEDIINVEAMKVFEKYASVEEAGGKLIDRMGQGKAQREVIGENTAYKIKVNAAKTCTWTEVPGHRVTTTGGNFFQKVKTQ